MKFSKFITIMHFCILHSLLYAQSEECKTDPRSMYWKANIDVTLYQSNNYKSEEIGKIPEGEVVLLLSGGFFENRLKEVCYKGKIGWVSSLAHFTLFAMDRDDYNAKMGEVATTTETTLGTNPGFYREIEQMVLRKNCISYLMDEAKMGTQFYTGDALENYVITQSQAMDDYGSFAKFMEQAFDWDLISYNFYPYYWGNRNEWTALYQTDNNDLLFRNFMQAGMARAIVTVRPGFEDAVMYYMSTGRIWNGGEVPVLGDPLYLSIVDELKEQEYVVEETWETVVPSALVALQSSGVAVEATGLPCGDDCKDAQENNPLKNNDSKLGVTIQTSPN